MYHENKPESTKNKKENSNSKSKKSPQWKDSNARRELKSMLLNDKDRKYLFMSAEKLQKLKPSFGAYQKGKFKDYAMALKSEVMKENKNWPEPWKDSRSEGHAKSLLLNDFDTHYTMNSKKNWELSPLFQQYPFEYFEIHLNRLKKQMAKNKDIIKADEAALRHDRLIIPIKMTTEIVDPRCLGSTRC